MDVALRDLSDFAKDFVHELPKERGKRAHIIGLSGELGAGKTTFVQRVAEELGVTVSVTSPTFVIAKVYGIPHPVFEHLIHVDAYRLLSEDADTIGWAEYQSDPANLILVEWPEQVKDFPKDAAIITFSVIDEEKRKIEMLR